MKTVPSRVFDFFLLLFSALLYLFICVLYCLILLDVNPLKYTMFISNSVFKNVA